MQNRTGTATAALVVGIVALAGGIVLSFPSWLTLVLGIVGIFLAASGMKECPQGSSGHGMAVAGLVLSIVAVCLAGVVWMCLCAGLAAFVPLAGVAALI